MLGHSAFETSDAGAAGEVEAHAARTRDTLKRSFDVVVALAMLIVFLPLFVLIAALIAVVDGPVVFYRHERIGRNGRRFGCLKFRTMVRDSDAQLARLLADDPSARHQWEKHRKLVSDPRILPGIGGLLRRSSLDELPQLLNILSGDMSIVGPRPIVEEEKRYYGHAFRLYAMVRPGLTGPWQIGDRADSTFEQRVALDTAYVRDSSLKTDAVILIKTAAIFLSGSAKGAY